MIFEQILQNIRNRVFHPVYFLMGEEPYFIDTIEQAIEKTVLNEDEKEFNQMVLYGKEVSIPDIINHAKRFPMMAAHQVIIIREAQNINRIEDLEPYIKSPVSSTILVISYKYKRLDKRTAFAKLIEKNHILFDSEKLRDYKIPDWIVSYLSEKHYSITPNAAQILADYLGTDLAKIVNELSKLFILLPEGTQINEQHIEENIGISKDFNVFELQNAIGKKDYFKANQIINYFGKNPKENPFVVVVSRLFAYFQKVLVYHRLANKTPQQVAIALGIKPFFVKDYELAAKNYPEKKVVQIIHGLRQYDMKSKGVDNESFDHAELMRELLFLIMH